MRTGIPKPLDGPAEHERDRLEPGAHNVPAAVAQPNACQCARRGCVPIGKAGAREVRKERQTVGSRRYRVGLRDQRRIISFLLGPGARGHEDIAQPAQDRSRRLAVRESTVEIWYGMEEHRETGIPEWWHRRQTGQ